MATAVGLNMKITADTAGIGRGVSKTEQMLGKLSKSSASAASSLRALVGIEIGTRLASAFAGAARAASDYALGVAKSIDETAKLAQRTGIAVEALQGFQVAADLSGVTNLEGGLQRLTISLGDAANGSATAQKAFANIGLSVDDLMGMAPEDQFRAVAAAISQIPGQAAQAAAAMDLFGRTGVELLPLFASNLEEVEARANRLGIVLSGDQTAAVEEMNDALDLVRKTFDGIIGQVTANLAPVVTALSEEFLSFVESFNGFGGGGGSGIADALTEGLLDFAEYMASIFDAAIAQFGEFGATLQTAASVFEFVGNVFVAVGESLRVVFNIFELAGNAIAQALGAFIEKIGAWVSSDLEEFGRQFKENAIEAGKQNSRDLESAASGVARAASAAVFGGPGLPQSSDGPASRAVQSARDRFANRRSEGAGNAASSNNLFGSVVSFAQQQAKTVSAFANGMFSGIVKTANDNAKKLESVNNKILDLEKQRAEQSAEIEGERLDALSRRSTQALGVGDVRSGGISDILRIASGREDPAIGEYRKQLGELQKMNANIAAMQAEKVKIIGGAGRAA